MNNFSGYTEIEVEGRILPFKFGTNAYALFCQMREIEFWQLAETGVFGKVDDKGNVLQAPEFTALRDLFFSAHQAAMRSKGQKEMVNEYQLGDLIDEYPEIIEQLSKTLSQAKLMGFNASKLSDMSVEKDEKKK